MRNIKSVISATALTVILSTSVMAGNIGGMRSNSTTSTDTTETSLAGNIGGMRNEPTSLIGQLAIFIKGNIGGMLVTVLP